LKGRASDPSFFPLLFTRVAILFGVTVSLRADETSGTIKTVDTNRSEVVLKGVVKDTVYGLEKDAQVWLDGSRCKLGDLSANDKATIIYEKKGDHLMAGTVRGLRKAKEAVGIVNDVFGDKREITLKGTVSNSTYELNKDGTVWADGKLGKLGDVRPGDQVLVTYEPRGDHFMAADVTVLKRK
jgi:hypothetical protein